MSLEKGMHKVPVWKVEFLTTSNFFSSNVIAIRTGHFQRTNHTNLFIRAQIIVLGRWITCWVAESLGEFERMLIRGQCVIWYSCSVNLETYE